MAKFEHHNWNLYGELGNARTLDDAWDVATTHLAQYGATHLMYVAVSSPREHQVTSPTAAAVVKTNYGEEFFDAFGHETFLDDDPTFEYCMTQTAPVFWHDPQPFPNVTPHQLEAAHVAADLGYGIGVSIPTRQFETNGYGGVGVNLPTVGTRQLSCFWEEHGAIIVRICGLLDDRMRNRHIMELIDLEADERDCLSYLAIGLRTGQIADRMGLRTRQVDRVIDRAKRRLSAASREHAVAKAIRLNLIEP